MKQNGLMGLVFLLFSCSLSGEINGVVDMVVNSYTEECVGEMEGNCLLVQEGDQIGTEDWSLFYYEDSIIGFDYEPGYIYHLRVKKKKIKNPPMDGSSISYRLVKIVSKEKV
ncbi:DUF4377 domain-containing protein [Salegentibacter sp. JZCK2]|uniref:DUF4377 domain-containing protein n=1 Tax=Salegentibacter tibetensis TaxID=2873600 RepID=UPI001CCB04BE|nr:DUF4377 domain-containing protein [Salegentibacter tibetensis]MBZ9730832.1 DUF4377 domain-containing protein [Salegentibacter tibetensis]